MQFGLFGGAKTKQGVAAGDSQGYRDFIDYVLEAEALGFASVFVVEHHFTGVGQVSASLNLLSYLAGRTSRIRLGTAVVVLPWHNPILLAEQAATVDLLSGGRLDLGIGRGYRRSEFDGFCIEMAEAPERFEEALAILRAAWSAEGRFSHHGQRWHYDNVVVEPRPVQRPHPPLWLAAGTAASIRRAAQDGFSLLLDQIGSIELTIERARIFRAAAGEPAGRQVAAARALHVALDETERARAYALRAQVLRAIGDLARPLEPGRPVEPTSFADGNIASEDAALIGTPEEIVARLRRLEAGGIDQVLLVDPTGSREALRLFAREVMPAFGTPEPARARA